MGSNAHHDSDGELIVGKGSKVITFPPRALNIVWGSDNRYWRLPDNKNGTATKEQEWQPAELVQVCWLEVTASVDIKPGKSYKVNFELALKSDAFGWNGCQVYIMAKIGKKGKYKWTKMLLDQESPNNKKFYPSEDKKLEVIAENGNDSDLKLYFGLYEIWSGKWKGGLQVFKAIVTEL